MAERIVFNNQAAKHIQAYIDYNNIVGDADGGKLMSEKEFEAFKKNQMQVSAFRILEHQESNLRILEKRKAA